MFDISRCVSYTGGSSLVARATRASLVISKTYIASHTCIGVCVCRRRTHLASSVRRSLLVDICGSVPLSSSTSTRTYSTIVSHH